MQLEMTLMQIEELRDGVASPPNGTHNPRQHYQPMNYESLLLDKLQDMVPIMPRGRELSKLEIINYVIDYIIQLREMVLQDQTMST